MLSLGFLNAYAEAGPDVLAELNPVGVNDPTMLLHGRWALAVLAAAQARDAADAAFAVAKASLASFEASFVTQQRVMKGQLRLGLQSDSSATTAFGLVKAPSKKKAATKATTRAGTAG